MVGVLEKDSEVGKKVEEMGEMATKAVVGYHINQ